MPEGFLYLPMPVRTRAIAETIPWGQDQPTGDCKQDAKEVKAAGLSPCPTQQIEDNQG